MSGLIESRLPRADYDKIAAISVTRLKELRRSPLHFQWAMQNPKASPAMTLGTATHVAVLEPERFIVDFSIWNRRTASGRRAPRNGGAWDAFQLENDGRVILTDEEGETANAIARAVRFDENANKYLGIGDPEVSLQWDIAGRHAKGRIDWLTTIDGTPTIVGLKTSRDCRHFAFGSQAARLGYHIQWAFYHDGYEAITRRKPALVEIVVESEAPHAVAVYRIPNDVIEQGRDEYTRLLEQLAECEHSGEWPGPQQHEEDLTLPSWVYQRDEDLSDLGLVA